MNPKTEERRYFYIILIVALLILVGPLFVERVIGASTGQATQFLEMPVFDYKSEAVDNLMRLKCKVDDDCGGNKCYLNYCQKENYPHIGKIKVVHGESIIGPGDGRYFLSKNVLYHFSITAESGENSFFLKTITEPNFSYDSKGVAENNKYYSKGSGKIDEMLGIYGIKISLFNEKNEYPFYFSFAQTGETVKYIYAEDGDGKRSYVVSIPITVV